MKQLVLIFTFLACTGIGFGQTVTEVKSENDSNKVYSKVDVEPGFPGGEKAWRDFLHKNVKWTTLIDNGAPAGTYKVIVKFIVNKDGSLSDIYCERYPGYGSCEEALRVMKISPKWKPALVNGIPVNAYRKQPFEWLVQE